MNPKRIPLHGAGPKKLLADFVKLLVDLGGDPRKFHLGGGTAIAARWRHRISTDADLFASHAAYKRFVRKIFRKLPEDALNTIEVELERRGTGNIEASEDGFSCDLPEDRPVSLYRQTPLIVPHLSEEIDAVHGIPLERTASIMLGKLVRRMGDRLDFVLRDAYDFIALVEKEPDEFKAMAQDCTDPATVGKAFNEAQVEIERQIARDPGWTGLAGPRNRPLIEAHKPHLKTLEMWKMVIEIMGKGADLAIKAGAIEKAVPDVMGEPVNPIPKDPSRASPPSKPKPSLGSARAKRKRNDDGHQR